MTTYVLERSQFLNRPLKDVFAFFERPENLARITPPGLGFHILSPSPIEMKTGAVIDYSVRPLLFPMRWTSIIEDYQPPFSFVDSQRRGPYALWRHTHRFEAVNGGTRVDDHVEYRLPFGFLGRIAHRLFVRRQLESIFAYRSSVIGRLL